jgi:hypothetical protein
VSTQLETLVARYREWREQLRAGIDAYHQWLDAHGQADIQRSLRLYDLAESLGNDRMVLAFLAEYSRGKTELINAIFFSKYRQRLLPSNVGRTTMCPTELFHDPGEEPSIRLLPIESRRMPDTIAALRHRPVEWVRIRLDPDNADSLAKSLATLAQTRNVSIEEADALGLLAEGDVFTTTMIRRRLTRVDIPAWRHALVNFPHPLLSSGLVVLDTPGLNALGTEPELTVSMIPNAHAVLFLLGMDTGVTRSDLEVWQKYVQGRVARSVAVLNKVDLAWDELKTEAEIAADVSRMVDETAHMLELPREHVIALSAQKALVARVRGDAALLERSGIRALERLLAEEIVPAKQEILRSAVQREVGVLVDASFETVRTALDANVAEAASLRQLSGRNRDMARAMLVKLEQDKAVYQQNVDAFRTHYSTFLRQGHTLLETLADDALDTLLADNRRSIEESWTTAGLLRGMRGLFDTFQTRSEEILAFAHRTADFVADVYRDFHEKHGFPRLSAPRLTLERHVLTMTQLRTATENFCADPANVVKAKFVVVRNFYEHLVAAARDVFAEVRRDFDGWLRNALAPLSQHLKDHQRLLERRVESLRKVSGDINTLAERTQQLETQRQALDVQLRELAQIRATIAGEAATAIAAAAARG